MRLLFLAAILLSGSQAVGAEMPVSKEYQIKAAFLYNFAKFVEWPASSFTNTNAPLVIGVFGKNPFGVELEAAVKDRKANGRAIVVKRFEAVEEAKGAHVLFFSSDEDGRVAEMIAALKGRSVLTVGESQKFVAAGGAINFVREADNVRFEINLESAKQSKLTINALLLELAKISRKKGK